MNSIETTLPSGAKLKITLAPFRDARDLYQALLEECKSLKVDPKAEVDVNFLKDVFCAGLSSKKVESSLWECMKRVTYNDLRITNDTFEPVEARADYLDVCFEVAKENIQPFTKALMQKFSVVLGAITKPPA